ncbi:MAG: hypothetical protein L0Z49_02845 [Actinobacteria bacterium]|nr:hypothetical protein [Actinomycetota bacterium]
MEPFPIFLTVLVLGFVIFYLFRMRKRQSKRMEEAPHTAVAAGLATVRDVFDATKGQHAPVAEFHVRGEEIHVTFDVPLPSERDELLEELLVDEAVEVVREKRHSLPIEEATTIVAHAGRGPVREVGRAKLPAPGQLPPPVLDSGVSLSHVAHDPFAAPFDDQVDHSIHYDVRAEAPGDDLKPLGAELAIPKGLDRGLRALGVNPETADGGELVLALLRMFGYRVSEQAYPGSYLALKDATTTYILTEGYAPGDPPEVSEAVIRRFLADFSSSGADRGMLVSARYAPFSIHEIESRQPRVRFVTRERVQRFIDGMALG